METQFGLYDPLGRLPQLVSCRDITAKVNPVNFCIGGMILHDNAGVFTAGNNKKKQALWHHYLHSWTTLKGQIPKIFNR